MRYLGGLNLFVSEFVIGSGEVNRENTKTETTEIIALHNWLDYKDSDWGMKRMNSDHTISVCFFHIVELDVFKELLRDLILIYKRYYPYAERNDFIKYVFESTLYDLKEIIDEKRKYFRIPAPVGVGDFAFYCCKDDNEYLDFAISGDRDIKYYQQYYKRIIQLINNIEYEETEKHKDGETEQPKALPPQQTETKTEQETIETKPVLKPEAVQTVFEIIKDFFSPEQQTELKQVIETGNKASTKLLFKGAGNRLTDTFKKLIEHDFITGCPKQDLINWIISNFNFIHRKKVKEFVYDTVEKTISRNYYPCQSPLIEIKNGQIQKVEQPRTKKYSKY